MKELLRRLARTFMPVYECRCCNKKLLYTGYSPIKRNYYARLLLTSEYTSRLVGWRWYSDFSGLVNSGRADFLISEISSTTFDFFRQIQGYILPVWTPARINIDRPECEIFNRNMTHFKDIRRRIRKYNLTCEVLNDEESFRTFNKRFYLPYIKSRHGNEAFLEDLNEMWKVHRHPFLLAIKENETIVGMSFCRVSDDSLHLMRAGLIDGKEEYMCHGIIGAIYYFGVLEGKKQGCKFLDLGGTRPFLTDKLTKYKVGLGAELVLKLSPTKEYLWFAVNENSKVAMDFLSENPFMYLGNDFILRQYSAIAM
jgi:hypothetical protein